MEADPTGCNTWQKPEWWHVTKMTNKSHIEVQATIKPTKANCTNRMKELSLGSVSFERDLVFGPGGEWTWWFNGRIVFHPLDVVSCIATGYHQKGSCQFRLHQHTWETRSKLVSAQHTLPWPDHTGFSVSYSIDHSNLELVGWGWGMAIMLRCSV